MHWIAWTTERPFLPACVNYTCPSWHRNFPPPSLKASNYSTACQREAGKINFVTIRANSLAVILNSWSFWLSRHLGTEFFSYLVQYSIRIRANSYYLFCGFLCGQSRTATGSDRISTASLINLQPRGWSSEPKCWKPTLSWDGWIVKEESETSRGSIPF